MLFFVRSLLPLLSQKFTPQFILSVINFNSICWTIDTFSFAKSNGWFAVWLWSTCTLSISNTIPKPVDNVFNNSIQMQIKKIAATNFRYVFAFHLNWRHLRHAENTCMVLRWLYLWCLYFHIFTMQNVATLLSAIAAWKCIKLPLFRMKIDFRLCCACFLSLFLSSIFYLLPSCCRFVSIRL